MSSYQITSYSRNQAKRLGVIIKPSSNKAKKLDVFDMKMQFICAVGATTNGDYPTYMASHGLKYANERRRLYKQRHEKDRHVVGSPGYYADQLLW